MPQRWIKFPKICCFLAKCGQVERSSIFEISHNRCHLVNGRIGLLDLVKAKYEISLSGPQMSFIYAQSENCLQTSKYFYSFMTADVSDRTVGTYNLAIVINRYKKICFKLFKLCLTDVLCYRCAYYLPSNCYLPSWLCATLMT